ncbi:MAG: hypothetical protein QOJ57_1855, partial [Thermoleophilaceae bacterium]|nr:hypothetical protein [Thermoleophilaceae bacterium]
MRESVLDALGPQLRELEAERRKSLMRAAGIGVLTSPAYLDRAAIYDPVRNQSVAARQTERAARASIEQARRAVMAARTATPDVFLWSRGVAGAATISEWQRADLKTAEQRLLDLRARVPAGMVGSLERQLGNVRRALAADRRAQAGAHLDMMTRARVEQARRAVSVARMRVPLASALSRELPRL